MAINKARLDAGYLAAMDWCRLASGPLPSQVWVSSAASDAGRAHVRELVERIIEGADSADRLREPCNEDRMQPHFME